MQLDFSNTTHLDDNQLQNMIMHATDGWSVGDVVVRVRYSRGADFSGTCVYATQRIYINLGKHLRYPYIMNTHIARGKTHLGQWGKPAYTVEFADGLQIAAFIYLHELYHLLVKIADRNRRQKETMCDRFATRYVVANYGATVRDDAGAVALSDSWDVQDLDRFVARARVGSHQNAEQTPSVLNHDQQHAQQVLTFGL